MRRLIFISAILFSTLTANTLLAQQAGNSTQGQRKGPPKEAIDACANKVSGNTCSATMADGKTITGTCMSRQQDRPLACRPADGAKADGQKRSKQN